ncbi:MAG: glycoside hydrolase family 127 protein [Armatimonadetes bacterium]|nr:glycoside hydrolase family 127 protein [Armatimonadota bacterium]
MSLHRFCKLTFVLALALGFTPAGYAQQAKAVYAEVQPKSKTGIDYIRKSIPKAKVPQITGKYYNDLVPDTLDLAERARLAVNALTRLTAEKLDYEVAYPGGITDVNTAACWQKSMEALPLMRTISGSSQNLHVDKIWNGNILHSMGPDGLYYASLAGRPARCQPDKWFYDVKFVVGQDYWSPTNIGRMLAPMALDYLITKDPVWLEEGKRMVDGYRRIAIDKGDYAYFETGGYPVNARIPINEGQMPSPWDGTLTAWTAHGLAQFYDVTKYEPARDLAVKLANYMKDHQRFIRPDGSWGSHFHTTTYAILALTDIARISNDKAMLDLAYKAYNFAKTQGYPEAGFFTEYALDSFPLSFGGRNEQCCTADMTALAIRFARAGHEECWEDADKFVRNQLAEAQAVNVSQAGVPEAVGEWHAYPTINDRCMDRGYGLVCCSPNAQRALYHVWESILSLDANVMKVNMLLNRASAWADVYSYIPYRGRVDIKMKQPYKVLVRIPAWTDKAKVACSVNDKPVDFSWSGSYVDVGKVAKGKTLKVTFPISERTESITVCSTDVQVGEDKTKTETYTLTFKGNEIVSVLPLSTHKPCYPTYQREHYRSDQPRFVKVKRFIPDLLINW